MSTSMLEIGFLGGDEEKIRPVDGTFAGRPAVLPLAWCGHILTQESESRNCEKTGMRSFSRAICSILSWEPELIRERAWISPLAQVEPFSGALWCCRQGG